MQTKFINDIHKNTLSKFCAIINSIEDSNIFLHIENNDSRLSISKDILLNIIEVQNGNLLPFSEAAKYIKKDEKTFQLILDNGSIKPLFISGELFISDKELDRYLKRVEKGHELMKFLADENQRLNLI